MVYSLMAVAIRISLVSSMASKLSLVNYCSCKMSFNRVTLYRNRKISFFKRGGCCEVLRVETWQVRPRHVYGRNNTVHRHPAVFSHENPSVAWAALTALYQGSHLDLNLRGQNPLMPAG